MDRYSITKLFSNTNMYTQENSNSREQFYRPRARWVSTHPAPKAHGALSTRAWTAVLVPHQLMVQQGLMQTGLLTGSQIPGALGVWSRGGGTLKRSETSWSLAETQLDGVSPRPGVTGGNWTRSIYKDRQSPRAPRGPPGRDSPDTASTP